MSTVADLPSSAIFDPRTWNWSKTGDKQEEFLGWKVPFADYEEFCRKTLYTTATISIGGGTITRVFPLVCPVNPNLIALEIRPGQPPQPNQRGQSHPGGPWEEILDEEDEPTGVYRPRVSAPPWGLVYPLVRFGVPAYPTTGAQAFVEIAEETNTERVTVPNHPYELIDEAGDHIEWVAQDIGLSRGASQFRVTWHEIHDLPAVQAVLHPLLDKVNSAAITIPLIGAVCPIGTLKAASKASSSTVSTGNNVKSTLSATLAYMPGGWNRAVASAPGHAGALRRINSAAGPPFAHADLAPFFNPSV